jgi:hypothetical protein
MNRSSLKMREIFQIHVNSRWMFHVLQVVQLADGVETSFLVLSEFSTPENFNWLVTSSPLPISEPTSVTVKIDRHFNIFKIRLNV